MHPGLFGEVQGRQRWLWRDLPDERLCGLLRRRIVLFRQHHLVLRFRRRHVSQLLFRADLFEWAVSDDRSDVLLCELLWMLRRNELPNREHHELLR